MKSSQRNEDKTQQWKCRVWHFLTVQTRSSRGRSPIRRTPSSRSKSPRHRASQHPDTKLEPVIVRIRLPSNPKPAVVSGNFASRTHKLPADHLSGNDHTSSGIPRVEPRQAQRHRALWPVPTSGLTATLLTSQFSWSKKSDSVRRACRSVQKHNSLDLHVHGENVQFNKQDLRPGLHRAQWGCVCVNTLRLLSISITVLEVHASVATTMPGILDLNDRFQLFFGYVCTCERTERVVLTAGSRGV